VITSHVSNNHMVSVQRNHYLYNNYCTPYRHEVSHLFYTVIAIRSDCGLPYYFRNSKNHYESIEFDKNYTPIYICMYAGITEFEFSHFCALDTNNEIRFTRIQRLIRARRSTWITTFKLRNFKTNCGLLHRRKNNHCALLFIKIKLF